MRLVVNKWGNSAGIRLPKQVLQKMKIDINDEMDYKIEGEKIILEKVNTVPEFTIEELF
ncbi:MAG: AbrB/MazE/SpoVT family DNA-binding domain-containing protein, partial [Candidatus Granulicatella sp. P6S_S16_bin.50.1]|nr:AbrB/MazE/SpoVT family DNA-binding domain-containing protein [Candidatus Granulicatella sp. P6S_S16_bin.50.1]